MTSCTSFYSLPQFHQAGLHFYSEMKPVINSSLAEKIKHFNQKKAEGYEYFKNCDYDSALEKYHQCLVIFKWIENKNPSWSNRQINDADLVYRTHPLSDEVKSYLITAYLNIAICSLKLEQWKEAETACDEVLKIDERSVKALYRKALAIASPTTAVAEDYISSIKYLKRALSIDPKNLEIKQKLYEIKQISKEESCLDPKKQVKNLIPNPFSCSINEIDEMIAKWEYMVSQMGGNDAELGKFQKNLEKIKSYKAQLKNSLEGLSEREFTKFKASKFGIDISDFISLCESKESKNKGIDLFRRCPISFKEPWEGWYFILLFFAIFMALFSFKLEKSGIFH